MTKTKVCSTCSIRKPIDNFPSHRGEVDGLSRVCKPCNRAKVRVWRENNPRKARERDLKRKYNMTLNEYETLLTAQGGGCAICGAKEHINDARPLFVDHCHDSGDVRGILCNNCNYAISLFTDNPALLEKAAAYLHTN